MVVQIKSGKRENRKSFWCNLYRKRSTSITHEKNPGKSTCLWKFVETYCFEVYRAPPKKIRKKSGEVNLFQGKTNFPQRNPQRVSFVDFQVVITREFISRETRSGTREINKINEKYFSRKRVWDSRQNGLRHNPSSISITFGSISLDLIRARSSAIGSIIFVPISHQQGSIKVVSACKIDKPRNTSLLKSSSGQDTVPVSHIAEQPSRSRPLSPPCSCPCPPDD